MCTADSYTHYSPTVIFLLFAAGDYGSLPDGFNAEFEEVTGGDIRFYKGISAPDDTAKKAQHKCGATHPVTYRITPDTVSATDYNGWHYHACSNMYR